MTPTPPPERIEMFARAYAEGKFGTHNVLTFEFAPVAGLMQWRVSLRVPVNGRVIYTVCFDPPSIFSTL